MLAEWALWLATPVPWRFRRLGLLGASVRLWSRGRRRKADWAAHEDRCHTIVGKAVAGLARHDTVLVLGSGLVRDVPLPLLAARFAKVILIDAVHLLPVRLAMRRYPNVRLVTRDLTGLIDQILGKGQARAAPLADLAADPAVDLVISANLLSQLALPVEDWLAVRPEARGRLPGDIGRRLIDWHLDDLAAFSARVCLLTDMHYRVLGRDGADLGTHDLLGGLKLPAPDDAWDWPVAPRGENGDGTVQVHSAGGYADWMRARSGPDMLRP